MEVQPYNYVCVCVCGCGYGGVQRFFQFNSIPYFTQTIIYIVHEVIKQYNNYSPMKANQKFIKLMGEQLYVETDI